MPSLRDFQRRFADDVLRASGTAPPTMRTSGSLGLERIAIYRRTIRWNYRNAMAATYPTVRRILGSALFYDMCDAYAVAHPSRSGDLNEYGDVFGDFLDRHAEASERAYVPDLARFEWAIDEANRAGDSHATPRDVVGALAQVPAHELPALRVQIDSSCRLLSSRFPLLRIWQVNQAGFRSDRPVDFVTGPDHLRIRREPPRARASDVDSGGVAIERIHSGSFEWLAALAAGETLSAALARALNADPGFDLQRALHQFIGDGTLTSIAADAGSGNPVTGTRGLSD